jgi:hypothetical protein
VSAARTNTTEVLRTHNRVRQQLQVGQLTPGEADTIQYGAGAGRVATAGLARQAARSVVYTSTRVRSENGGLWGERYECMITMWIRERGGGVDNHQQN